MLFSVMTRLTLSLAAAAALSLLAQPAGAADSSIECDAALLSASFAGYTPQSSYYETLAFMSQTPEEAEASSSLDPATLQAVFERKKKIGKAVDWERVRANQLPIVKGSAPAPLLQAWEECLSTTKGGLFINGRDVDDSTGKIEIRWLVGDMLNPGLLPVEPQLASVEVVGAKLANRMLAQPGTAIKEGVQFLELRDRQAREWLVVHVEVAWLVNNQINRIEKFSFQFAPVVPLPPL